jgi:hypothetical protein
MLWRVWAAILAASGACVTSCSSMDPGDDAESRRVAPWSLVTTVNSSGQLVPSRKPLSGVRVANGPLSPGGSVYFDTFGPEEGETREVRSHSTRLDDGSVLVWIPGSARGLLDERTGVLLQLEGAGWECVVQSCHLVWGGSDVGPGKTWVSLDGGFVTTDCRVVYGANRIRLAFGLTGIVPGFSHPDQPPYRVSVSGRVEASLDMLDTVPDEIMADFYQVVGAEKAVRLTQGRNPAS